MSKVYIETKPPFKVLVELEQLTRDVQDCIAALAEGNDTVQRAADLKVAGCNLYYQIQKVTLEEGEN